MSPRKALIAALLAASAARADGSATTLLDSSPYLRGSGYQQTPIYESFALSARGDGTEWMQDLRITARGWGRLTLGPPFDEKRGTGDLESLFIEGKLLDRRLLLRVGRQLAVGGALRATNLDGVTARATIVSGLGVELWGGSPVQPRFNTSSGDVLTGGRVFFRNGFDSEVGASFVYALRRGYLARKDFALDGSYTPLRTVTITGLVQWSLEEHRMAEGRLQALWQITPRLQLVADGSRTSPDLFLDRDSIFAVFSQERRDELGGELAYRFTGVPLRVSADWHWVSLEGGDGQRAAARATFVASRNATYGAELRFLNEPENGYKQARVFCMRKLPYDVTVTIDLDGYWLDHSINNQPRSLTASASVGMPLTAQLDLMVAGSLGDTPYFERRAEAVARLTYRFGLPGGLR